MHSSKHKKPSSASNSGKGGETRRDKYRDPKDEVVEAVSPTNASTKSIRTESSQRAVSKTPVKSPNRRDAAARPDQRANAIPLNRHRGTVAKVKPPPLNEDDEESDEETSSDAGDDDDDTVSKRLARKTVGYNISFLYDVDERRRLWNQVAHLRLDAASKEDKVALARYFALNPRNHKAVMEEIGAFWCLGDHLGFQMKEQDERTDLLPITSFLGPEYSIDTTIAPREWFFEGVDQDYMIDRYNSLYEDSRPSTFSLPGSFF